jgi:hypothetical protein
VVRLFSGDSFSAFSLLGIFPGPTFALWTYTDGMLGDNGRFPLRLIIGDALIILVPALVVLVMYLFWDVVAGVE